MSTVSSLPTRTHMHITMPRGVIGIAEIFHSCGCSVTAPDSQNAVTEFPLNLSVLIFTGVALYLSAHAIT